MFQVAAQIDTTTVLNPIYPMCKGFAPYNMPFSSEREVIRVCWPLTIPSHAQFLITSPYPLKASYRCNLSFILTLDAPIHLSSPSPIEIIPSGALSPGFAQGWTRLPPELKLAILRYNVVVPHMIWPSNANSVIRDILIHYLRMTPEIAGLSRALFFAENTFIILPFREDLSMFCHLPPVSVRPLLRRITLLTWLEERDSHAAAAIAERGFGFQNLTHIIIQCSCIRFVKHFLLEKGLDAEHSTEKLIAQMEPRLPPPVSFETKGRIEFLRAESQSAGGSPDAKLLELVEHVERLMKQRFRFEFP